MRKRLTILYPFYSLLVGLVLTQILATVHVYSSNTALYDSLLAIKNAGYLTVPNQHVMDGLHKMGPAFFGGLFFTFSIGAGISLLALAMAWIWNRVVYRSQYLLYFYLLLWSGCLIALNLHGFKLFLTLYVFLLPPAVFLTAAKSMSYLSRQNRRPNDIIHIMPLIVLALLLTWQIDNRLFLDFRDIYLFSNPVGARINSFYYKYTLYPAEAFKSLNQKMLKTGVIEAQANTAGATLENILLNYDYIPVGSNIDVDLKIVYTGDDFIFKQHDRPILRISSQALFANPDKTIREFENKSDTTALFRQVTFISLLVGLPLAIYIIAHGLISILAGFFIEQRTSSVMASGLCFVVGIVLMFAFQFNRGRDVSVQNIAAALESDRWQTRVAALRVIDEKGLEINRFQTYPKLLTSAHIAERYWLARALAKSRSPATFTDLMVFLKDAHPNVVTMALYAIGKRGNREAIDKIMPIIATSDDWYSQWYAYRALRSIGWRQTKSK